MKNYSQITKAVTIKPINCGWLTTGNPLRYLKATLKFAMRMDNLKDEIFTGK